MMRSIAWKYVDLPIIVAAESMADIAGWTSVVGKLQYIGSKDFENDDLVCLSEDGYTGSSVIRSSGLLRYMEPSELLCSLVEFNPSQWGLKAICHALRYVYSDVPLLRDIKSKGLEGKLRQCLLTAIELNEDDQSILEIFDLWLQQ